jgi:hypothetical protein
MHFASHDRPEHAAMSAEPMAFDCERIVDSGFGCLVTMVKTNGTALN